MLLNGLNGLLGIISLGVLCLSVFALIDAAIRPAQVFPAAEKQTKQFWLIILGLATAWQLFFGLFGGGLFIGIIGVIAVIVYIVDVRPAVRSLGRGGRSQGPYGPW
jgi:Protein of unknown function (DUF2516)